MIDIVLLCMYGAFSIFCAGFYFGGKLEASRWVSKSDPKYRTAIHRNGKFFFVMTEKEFIKIKDIKGSE